MKQTISSKNRKNCLSYYISFRFINNKPIEKKIYEDSIKHNMKLK